MGTPIQRDILAHCTKMKIDETFLEDPNEIKGDIRDHFFNYIKRKACCTTHPTKLDGIDFKATAMEKAFCPET